MRSSVNPGLVISLAGLGTGIIGIAFATATQAASRRSQALDKRKSDFIRARDHLKHNRGALAKLAVAPVNAMQWDKSIPLLTRPGWIPDRPLALGELSLTISAPTQAQLDALDLARSKVASYFPAGGRKQPNSTYSQAILEYDKATRMENQPCYRLTGLADPKRGTVRTLQFTRAAYFDGIDTEEALAYEAALRDLKKSGTPFAGPYHKWLGDPFDLGRRAALAGINTLTIRLSRTGPRFYMHRRGPDAGLSMGGFNVVPAGEFQPQIDDPTIWDSDLNILSNVIREYVEEFLGVPEASGRGGIIIDFENETPYKEFWRAFRSGRMKVFYLGTGLDPVSWKPEILTVCVFDEQSFEKLFEKMVTDKIDEGTGGVLLAGNARSVRGKIGGAYGGLAFDRRNISEFANLEKTLPAGVACLALAERWTPQLFD
jgi:hypothetical protein